MENKINSIKKKSIYNINMPRLSKNDKIRRDTIKILNEIKSKLNPKSYTAFLGHMCPRVTI